MILLTCGIEWTNWTNKENGDRFIDSRMTASGRSGEGVEGLSKKEKDSWTTVWWLQGGGGIRGLSGNGRNTIKFKSKKEQNKTEKNDFEMLLKIYQ